MSTPNIDTGIITALATLGMVFGIIGLLFSFIPCFGSYALFLSLPSSIASGFATWFSYKNGSGKGLPVAALTISTLGLAISSHQFYVQYSIIHQGTELLNENLQRRNR
jgi:TM2 domain-containing membrane protein YozV